LGDTSVPAIIKATAADYLGNLPTQNSLQALLNCLKSNDPQTRYRTLSSLTNFAAASWRADAGFLLSDKIRSVRIAAATLYNSIPTKEIPDEFLAAFNSAQKELHDYLIYQADFSVGNLMIADHYFHQQDYFNAEKYYIRGLIKDSMMNYARLNLSATYSAQGKNDQALQVLQTAVKIDPTNDRIYYNLGLLYNEMHNSDDAEKSFKMAINLKSTNPRVYYNYGLLLNESKKFDKAERVLLKGIEIDSQEPELYYALTYVYMNSNNQIKARDSAIKLKQLDPDNPDYQQLFRTIGI